MNSDTFKFGEEGEAGNGVSTTNDQDFDRSIMDALDESNNMDRMVLPGSTLSPTDSTSGVKRKPRIKDEKICRVCGDKALGYNFNAMTCESCKAFFRRNALKEKSLKCLFKGDCQVDVRTRRFCPACRLIKCLEAGMKKEMILDDTEKKARMQKVVENRKRRSFNDSGVLDTSSIKEEPVSDSDMLPDQSCQTSTQQPMSSQLISLSEGLKMELPYRYNALKAPEVVDPGDNPKDPLKYRILAPEEKALFKELGDVYKNTLGELLSDRNSDDLNNCTDLINQSEVAVRRLISFFKHLEDFQRISHDNQIAALKACVLCSILLRSAYFFDPNKSTWTTKNGEVSSSVLKTSTGYGEIHDIHTDFCRKIKQLIGSDVVAFALLQLICSFNPDGKDIKCPSQVSNLQDKYMVLLKHYLEAEYTYSVGQSLFVKLMMMLLDMRRVADFHNEILLKANPRDIAPLMLEVLDLKC